MVIEYPSLKAARDVRLIIQRVRVATPENFEELESELLQALEAHLDDLGDKFASVQDSADKGLEIARKRVDGILKKREEEEAKDQIPKLALEELKELIKSFEDRTAEFQASACFEGEATISKHDLSVVEGVTSDFAQELQMFVKSYAGFVTRHMAVIKSPTLAPTIKTEFAQSSTRVDQRKKIAEGLLAKAKSNVAKALAGVKKELLEQAKVELKDRLKDCTAPLAHATEAVLEAERAVEPFAKAAKNVSEEEMLFLATDVDIATRAAREAVDSAKESLQPPETVEVNELIKAELNQWLASEAKKPELRIGQLDRRIARVVQLVRQYRRDVNKVRHKEMLQEMLPGLLEQAKAAADDTQTIAKVDLAIKSAEQQVQPLLKSAKMSEAKMHEVADKAAAALAVAKEEARLAQQALRPIDETLDDDLKKQLNEKVGPVVKKTELRISGMEKRLTRVTNLIDRFREDIRKTTAGRVAEVKEAALKVMTLYREAQSFSIEDMFSAFDIHGNGHFDENQFLSFFEQAGVPDGELAEKDLKALFSLHAKDGVMTQDTYMDFMIAYMKVTKPTVLTEGLAIAGCKALRQLKIGELLQVIDGPKLDDGTGLSRVQVQPVVGSDLSIGWATMANTVGAAFLRPCPAAEVAKARQ